MKNLSFGELSRVDSHYVFFCANGKTWQHCCHAPQRLEEEVSVTKDSAGEREAQKQRAEIIQLTAPHTLGQSK